MLEDKDIKSIGNSFIFWGIFNLSVTFIVAVADKTFYHWISGVLFVILAIFEIYLGNRIKHNKIAGNILSKDIAFVYILTILMLLMGGYLSILTFIMLIGLYNKKKASQQSKDNAVFNKPIDSASLPFPQASSFGETNKCPYCKKLLDKIPTRKSKCPFCNEQILCRTRPSDRAKILIRENQVKNLERLWEKYYEEKEEARLMEDPEYVKIKENLQKAWGFKPAMRDIKWGLLNKRSIEFASKRQWGLYRNTRLDMASQLKKEKSYQNALTLYLEVCYLDLNGAENIMEGLSDEELLRFDVKDFDVNSAFLAPGVLSELLDVVNELKLPTNELEKIFLSDSVYKGPLKSMPLSAERAWGQLLEEINKMKENENKLLHFNPEDTTYLIEEIRESRKENEQALVPLIYKFRNANNRKTIIRENHIKIEAFIEFLLFSQEISDLYRKLGIDLLVYFAKKENVTFEPLVLKFLSNCRQYEQLNFDNTFWGELGAVQSKWVESFLPEMVNDFKKEKDWNKKRFIAFNLGKIGSNAPELIKEAIPIMMDYIVKNKCHTTPFGFNEKYWLKDAYLDSLGSISDKHPEYIRKYEKMIKDIAENDKSEYSRKKATYILTNLKV